MRWVSVGAVTATVLWVIASAGVVVLLMWLWITNFLVLLVPSQRRG